MSQALVNPEILSWARDRAGLSLSVLAKKMSIKEERLEAWEAGERKPTFKQAKTLANKNLTEKEKLLRFEQMLEQNAYEIVEVSEHRVVGQKKVLSMGLMMMGLGVYIIGLFVYLVYYFYFQKAHEVLFELKP